jgi:alkaline phosphatase D
MMRRASLLLCVVIGLAGIAAAETSEEVFPQSVASGDPRPTSVVLWTRVVSPLDVDPIVVTLNVATDAAFQSIVHTRQVEVNEMYDGVVKVLVDGLMPYTTYYYRFSHGEWMTRVGRTSTAPTPDMDVDASFAVIYCQDYIDRYYNSLVKLLRDYDEDLDFVVHLGDYIYETTDGSDGFPPQTSRDIVFEDLEGALMIGTPDAPAYAAASIDNYRQIYRIYRSDPVMQQVHERWPMIVIWDDHEYSNDHWGATATYFNGRFNEYNPIRRQNAEQAFFEWVPIEVGLGNDGLLDINAAILYPNTMIYRDFMFGSNLHLIMTDGRTFRPDHLIPEDAFPGAIPVDQQRLIEVLPIFGLDFEDVGANFDPYVNMDALAAFLPILRQTATLIAANLYASLNPALDLTTAVAIADNALSGNQSATFINALFEAFGLDPPFSNQVLAVLPRGISYQIMGKILPYSSAGARTQVLHDPFNIYAAHLYLMDPAYQEVYGGQQTAWIQGTVIASPATWRVLGQSVMMTPLVIDFTHPLIAPNLPPGFPPELQTRLGLNLEDFNGFPQKRFEMISLLKVKPNSVVISGDIHATYVTDHTDGVYEFTPPSVSSGTLGAAVLGRIASDPILGQFPGLEQLVAAMDLLILISSLNDELVSPSDIVWANNWAHGFMVMTATSESLNTLIYEIPYTQVGRSYYDNPAALDPLFTILPFTVLGDGTLITPF